MTTMLGVLLRVYLVLGFALEVQTFVRLYVLSTPIAALTPSLSDPALDNVPAFRRLYAVYCISLGLLRLAAAVDIKNKGLLAALAIVHVVEAAFSIAEVLVFQHVPPQALLDEPHLKTTGFLALLVAQALLFAYGYMTASTIKSKMHEW
ncbi:hypothetical protein H310_11355 [Aphanomyces invadans]|uniref:Uncharacterized protein n=1 Tax=Aphanomyces invadans TaxID=157072 RepID=A0A024TN49_9STRA|nr:hypothetical protein H310_11355 [Aphanomyces invadans]ETV95061.1 hypothetical protein H310_11355 [Aphanomyces invadans]|eukprot:XP_008876234.1 hypothetical protein H310_11355 [Aphanomyces invadans]